MDARLVVVAGARPDLIPLRHFPIIVGRSSESGLKVCQAEVSRWHCELYVVDDELAVRDLDSSNGTYVNGQRIDRPVLLLPGDELHVGTVVFRVEYSLGEGSRPQRVPGRLIPADDPASPADGRSFQERQEGSFVMIDVSTGSVSQPVSSVIGIDPTPTEYRWDDE